MPGRQEILSRRLDVLHGLVRGTTRLDSTCGGNYDLTCSRPSGECAGGHCCLPATYSCAGGSCCSGLVCGTTSLGHAGCGNFGAACSHARGTEYCDALERVNGKCH